MNASPIGFNNLFIRSNGLSNHLDAFIHYPYKFFPFQRFSISVSFAFHGHIGKSFSVLVSQSLSQSISHKSFRSDGQFLDSRVSYSVNQPAN